MHKVYDYYIGLNDKDKHTQLLLTDTFKDKINRILQAYNVHNFSMFELQGFYQGGKENSLMIRTLDKQLDKIILNDIKKELNQECIMEVISDCDVRFI